MEGQQGSDRRQYDLLLDKVISITENNLKAQNLYLNELTLIKNRFEINDRDHSEVKEHLATVTHNTLDILNKMNRVSNDDILLLLEKNETCNNNFTFKFDTTEKNIQSINDKIALLYSLIESNKEIKKAVLETEKSFSLIQKLLGAILIIVAGVQIATFAWKSVKDNALNDSIKYIIREEIKKAK